MLMTHLALGGVFCIQFNGFWKFALRPMLDGGLCLLRLLELTNQTRLFIFYEGIDLQSFLF